MYKTGPKRLIKRLVKIKPLRLIVLWNILINDTPAYVLTDPSRKNASLLKLRCASISDVHDFIQHESALDDKSKKGRTNAFYLSIHHSSLIIAHCSLTIAPSNYSLGSLTRP